MCGRYKCKGDKQRIAEAFHINRSLEEADFGKDEDFAPESEIPITSSYNSLIENTIGERSISPSGPRSAALTNNVSGV